MVYSYYQSRFNIVINSLVINSRGSRPTVARCPGSDEQAMPDASLSATARHDKKRPELTMLCLAFASEWSIWGAYHQARFNNIVIKSRGSRPTVTRCLGSDEQAMPDLSQITDHEASIK